MPERSLVVCDVDEDQSCWFGEEFEYSQIVGSSTGRLSFISCSGSTVYCEKSEE